MKHIGKPVIFIVAALIIVFTTLSFTGISTTYGDKKNIYVKGASDIRWGIDIRGGVDVTFSPDLSSTTGAAAKISSDEIKTATEVMKQRLISKNITDSEVYADTKNNNIIVRFPWKESDTTFNPEETIKDLGNTSHLVFRSCDGADENGKPTNVSSDVIVEGKNVKKAEEQYGQTSEHSSAEYYVKLQFDSTGAKEFGDATTKLAQEGKSIAIYMDEQVISVAKVNTAITDGTAIISGSMTQKTASELANNINDGALPFKLKTETYSTISPTLGAGALNSMMLAGIIAFALICIFMISFYRLPGAVACIALAGHIGGMIACTSGFIPGINSYTLTIPGVAGIILSIGMGVDANIITAERIKDELYTGKSIDGAIDAGSSRGFTAIFDGNITVVIVAIILMGSFGSPTSVFAQMLAWLFFMFGPSSQGTIFSFGYTLLLGVLFNFLFSVFLARVMVKSLSKFKCFRNPWLYGGEKNNG